MKEKQLEELMGMVQATSPRYSYRGPSVPPGGTAPDMANVPGAYPNVQASTNLQGLQFGNCRRMHPWQANIVAQLAQGKDVYILASPGGGKTTPFMCYWAKYLLRVNPDFGPDMTEAELKQAVDKIIANPSKIPKMLILSPTVSLSIQTKEEIIKDMSEIVVKIVERTMERINLSRSNSQYKKFNPNLKRLFLNNFGRKYNNAQLEQLIDERDSLVIYWEVSMRRRS